MSDRYTEAAKIFAAAWGFGNIKCRNALSQMLRGTAKAARKDEQERIVKLLQDSRDGSEALRDAAQRSADFSSARWHEHDVSCISHCIIAVRKD